MSKKILVIDDEQTRRCVLTQILSEWSYQCVEAVDISSALQLFETEQPALTLFDISFRNGDGMDLLQKIKLRQPFAKVIVITDADSLENTVDALRIGTVFLIVP